MAATSAGLAAQEDDDEENEDKDQDQDEEDYYVRHDYDFGGSDYEAPSLSDQVWCRLISVLYYCLHSVSAFYS